MSEIAIIVDADRDYVRKLVKKIIKSGDIERIGKKKTPYVRTSEILYAVKHRDDFYLKYVLEK